MPNCNYLLFSLMNKLHEIFDSFFLAAKRKFYLIGFTNELGMPVGVSNIGIRASATLVALSKNIFSLVNV